MHSYEFLKSLETAERNLMAL